MVRTESPDRSLSNKVVVVVGGGRGMGRATAKKFAAAGAHVTVAARTATDLEAVVAEIRQEGGQASAHVMDVTKAGDIIALTDKVHEASGHIDVLVNSAGVSLIAPLDETSEAEWNMVLDTNLKGPCMVIRAMLDLLRASDGANIVNIASKAGLTGHGLVTAYTAAKAGLIGFGRARSLEDSVAILKRNLSEVVTRGQGIWWSAGPSHIDPVAEPAFRPLLKRFQVNATPYSIRNHPFPL